MAELSKEEAFSQREFPNACFEQTGFDLQDRIKAFLADKWPAEVALHQIRRVMGHSEVDEANPLANAVHRALAELRDAGEIICIEPEWGNPRFAATEMATKAASVQPAQVFTLNDYKRVRTKLRDGTITANELKREFERMTQSKESLVGELKASHKSGRGRRQGTAEAIFKSLLQLFALGATIACPPETFEDAVASIVNDLDEERLLDYFESWHAARAEREKALGNPESLEDFEFFFREKGLEALSDEQLVRYDTLATDRSRALCKDQKTPSDFGRIDSGDADSLRLLIIEGYHGKRKIRLWIVQLSERVSRETWTDLNKKARMLGGWWSSYVKAQTGFQFKSQVAAEKFVALRDGYVDREDELTQGQVS